MFDKTKARLNAKYVEPVNRGIAAAIMMAAAALLFALLAFMRGALCLLKV